MFKGKLYKGSTNSAGYDLYSEVNEIIPAGTRKLIPTGVFLELKPLTWGLIKSRSGLSCRGIDVGAGVIDSDYKGEIQVLICNNSDQDFIINIGNKIAQLIILPHLTFDNYTTEAATIERGNAGFGSTGF